MKRGVNYTPSPLPRGRLIRRNARCFPLVLPPNPAAGPAGTGMGRKPRGGIKVPWGRAEPWHECGSTGVTGALGQSGCKRKNKEGARC